MFRPHFSSVAWSSLSRLRINVRPKGHTDTSPPAWGECYFLRTGSHRLWQRLLQLGLLWTLVKHDHFSLVYISPVLVYSPYWVASCTQTMILVYLFYCPVQAAWKWTVSVGFSWWQLNVSVLLNSSIVNAALGKRCSKTGLKMGVL